MKNIFLFFLLMMGFLNSVRVCSLEEQTNSVENEKLHDQLLSAIRTDNKEAIKTAIFSYKQQEAKLDDYRQANHETPLMYAALLGKKDIVELLLEHGANPEAENLVDQTAIDYAQKGLAEARKNQNTIKMNEFQSIITLLKNAHKQS